MKTKKRPLYLTFVHHKKFTKLYLKFKKQKYATSLDLHHYDI